MATETKGAQRLFIPDAPEWEAEASFGHLGCLPFIKEAKSLDSPAPGSACEPLAVVLSVGLDCVLSSLYLTRGSESPMFQGFEE